MNKFQNFFYNIEKNSDNPEKLSVKKTLVYSFFALILLCLVNSLLTFIFKPDYIYPEVNRRVIFFLRLILTSLLEEIIFRFFLPESLRKTGEKFIKDEKKLRFYKLSVEISIIVIFALLHSYLGTGGIINAFFAAIIFRLLYFSTGHLYSPCLTHTVYNVTQGIILMLQVSL